MFLCLNKKAPYTGAFLFVSLLSKRF